MYKTDTITLAMTNLADMAHQKYGTRKFHMKSHEYVQVPLFAPISDYRINSFSCNRDQYNRMNMGQIFFNYLCGRLLPGKGTGMTNLKQINDNASNFSITGTLAIFLCISSGAALAGDYYVNPTGSASWANCTSIGTYCSPQAAMQNAMAGDTVYFRGGTYNITGPRTPYHGLLEPQNHGTQSNPIVFIAYNNEIPTISVECTSAQNQCIAIGTNEKNYITWDGFTIRSSNNKNVGAFIGGETLSTGPVFQNNTVIAGTLLVTNMDNYDLTRMEETTGAVYRNNRVSGLNSTNNSAKFQNNACLKIYDNDNAIIENNEFYDCPTGISAKRNMDNTIIRYNYFHDNYLNMWNEIYVTNIVQSSTDNIIHNNIFAKAGYMHINVNSSEYAVAGRWRIYNNTFYDGGSMHSHVSLGASEDLTFYNNIFSGGGAKQFTTIREYSTLSSMDHNQFGTSPYHSELRRYHSSAAVYNSLSSWKSSGELIGGADPGVGSLTSNTLFLNGSGTMTQILDFKLASGSPELGAGRNGVDMGANANLVGPSLVSPPKPPTVTAN